MHAKERGKKFYYEVVKEEKEEESGCLEVQVVIWRRR